MDKIVSLLERVTSGNAGTIDLEYYHHNKTCTITWKRPRGLINHASWNSRVEMFLYVKDILVGSGVAVSASTETTHEEFLPED